MSMYVMRPEIPDELAAEVQEAVEHAGYQSVGEFIRDATRRQMEAVYENCFRCGSDVMVEEHHTNYAQNETVLLCRSCHVDVHTDEDDPLYPEDIENSPHRGAGVRPNVDVGDDVMVAVKEFAAANGLRQSRAWGELVRSGLRHEFDWDDPYVNMTKGRTQRELVMSMSKSDRVQMNADRLKTFEKLGVDSEGGIAVTPVRCIECGAEEEREAMIQVGSSPGSLVCPACATSDE